jgi:hypothetical protein
MKLIDEVELTLCSVATQAKHPELFHYTPREAFESIITSNTFWASHYRDMTDQQEVLLLKGALPAAVAAQYDAITSGWRRHDRRAFRATGGSKNLARDFVNSLYAATFEGKARFGALDAFVVSFSTHADDDDFVRANGLPSQWTEYAGPNGLCIVMDTTALATHLGIEADNRYWIGPRLDPVRYAGAPIEELFPELVDASGKTLQRFLAGEKTPDMGVPDFLAGATLLKAAEFRSEREVRIVGIAGNGALSDQAVRDHSSTFKRLPLPTVRARSDGRRYATLFEGLGLKLPIKRVIVGPSEHQADNAAFARSLVGDTEVTLSTSVRARDNVRPLPTGRSNSGREFTSRPEPAGRSKARSCPGS